MANSAGNEPSIEIITEAIRLGRLVAIAAAQFGDLVKAVVDVELRIMAIGGELHADEEAVLLERGSKQASLWGINLYPDQYGEDDWIEFDSMINVRPSQQNRSRGVENRATQATIRQIVRELVRADD